MIKKTWEKDAIFLEYYSDHADPSIPTINLGVPNTERGKGPFALSYTKLIQEAFVTVQGQLQIWRCMKNEMAN